MTRREMLNILARASREIREMSAIEDALETLERNAIISEVAYSIGSNDLQPKISDECEKVVKSIGFRVQRTIQVLADDMRDDLNQ